MSAISPLINTISGKLVKNDEMYGARILRNEAYIQYAAMTKGEAQQSRSRFSAAGYGLVTLRLMSSNRVRLREAGAAIFVC